MCKWVREALMLAHQQVNIQRVVGVLNVIPHFHIDLFPKMTKTQFRLNMLFFFFYSILTSFVYYIMYV